MNLSPLYDLLRVELESGIEDSDTATLNICKIANDAIKDFLRTNLTWNNLLEILDYLGLDVDQYQKDIEANFKESNLPWF